MSMVWKRKGSFKESVDEREKKKKAREKIKEGEND